MVKLRDHYFVAWLVTKGYMYDIVNGEILVSIKSDEYQKLKDEYKCSLKPILVNVRKLVKELNSFLTSTSNMNKNK